MVCASPVARHTRSRAPSEISDLVDLTLYEGAVREKDVQGPRVCRMDPPSPREIEDMSATAVATEACEWANEVDQDRRRSGRIPISGRMRDRLALIKEAIMSLARRAEDKGDAAFVKSRNDELVGQVRASNSEIARLRSQMEAQDRCMVELEQEIRRLNAVHSGPVRAAVVTVDKAVSPVQALCEYIQETDKHLDVISSINNRVRTELEKDDTSSVTPAENRHRKRPRIVSDIRIAPPRKRAEAVSVASTGTTPTTSAPAVDGMKWTRVESNRSARKKRQSNKGAEAGGSRRNKPKPARSIPSRRDKADRRRLPRNSVVAIKVMKETTSYAEVLKKAREKVSLKDLGIETTRIQKAVDGGLLIEVPGKEDRQRADALAGSLREVLGEDAKVYRPTMRGELLVRGLDDSVDPTEITGKSQRWANVHQRI